jgi:hypothetical protein
MEEVSYDTINAEEMEIIDEMDDIKTFIELLMYNDAFNEDLVRTYAYLNELIAENDFGNTYILLDEYVDSLLSTDEINNSLALIDAYLDLLIDDAAESEEEDEMDEVVSEIEEAVSELDSSSSSSESSSVYDTIVAVDGDVEDLISEYSSDEEVLSEL